MENYKKKIEDKKKDGKVTLYTTGKNNEPIKIEEVTDKLRESLNSQGKK